MLDPVDLEPGMIVLAPVDVDLDTPTRCLVVLSDPTAPAVRVCPAGEDPNGNLCETPETLLLTRDALARCTVVDVPVLPWPRAR